MSLIRVSAVFNWRPFEGFQSFAANAERANEQIVDLTLQRNINEYLRPMEAIDPGPSIANTGGPSSSSIQCR